MPRRFSFADVTSGLALFVALGGTATAAVTLDRDSVGSVQIAKDAVRSPEIDAGAVRSSELRDGGIALRDIADDAREALEGDQEPERGLRWAKDDAEDVPHCDSGNYMACPNLLSVRLTPGSWLVQSTFGLDGDPIGMNSHCGLVLNDFIPVDEAAVLGGSPGWSSEQMALSGVATIAPEDGPQRVALRCNERDDASLELNWAKLTALEVSSATEQ
jgi:hypothetical protein